MSMKSRGTVLLVKNPMLLYECFYMAVSGSLKQYLKMFKKFSLGAEYRDTESENRFFPLHLHTQQDSAMHYLHNIKMTNVLQIQRK